MKMTSSFTATAVSVLAGAFLFASSATASVDPIVIKGNHFFYKTNGSEFFMRGMAYQQDVNSNTTAGSTFTDPLADVAGCTRDIPLLQQLGTNVIRVYAIDPTKDHSQCMNMLDAAGIYVLQDLSNPSNSINRNQPRWTTDLFQGYAAVVDAMANYTNVLGFFAGNEVPNDLNNTDSSAFVKAAARDMKAYIKTKGYRTIGVGYATNDDANIRTNMESYFNCGDQASAIDFWGYNIYSWCGASSYTVSGYDQRTAELANYSIPVFFAEYGCNTVQPRIFTEVQALYGPNMTGVWSGGILYMYFQEANDYGLVQVSGSSVSKLPDFTAFSKQINSIKPSSTAMSAYTPKNTVARACPTVDSNWRAASALPPIANPQVCDCMMSSLSCTANTGISSNDTENLFDYICGKDNGACAGIVANGTTGNYGAYSMCNSHQQLSFAMNKFYLDNNKASTACDFSGNAAVQNNPSPASSCSAVLSAAGSAGTGTVTNIPTGAGSPTSSGGGAAASTSKKSDAGGLIIPHFDMGITAMGIYVAVAALTGVGMVLL